MPLLGRRKPAPVEPATLHRVADDPEVVKRAEARGAAGRRYEALRGALKRMTTTIERADLEEARRDVEALGITFDLEDLGKTTSRLNRELTAVEGEIKRLDRELRDARRRAETAVMEPMSERIDNFTIRTKGIVAELAAADREVAAIRQEAEKRGVREVAVPDWPSDAVTRLREWAGKN